MHVPVDLRPQNRSTFFRNIIPGVDAASKRHSLDGKALFSSQKQHLFHLDTVEYRLPNLISPAL